MIVAAHSCSSDCVQNHFEVVVSEGGATVVCQEDTHAKKFFPCDSFYASPSSLVSGAATPLMSTLLQLHDVREALIAVDGSADSKRRLLLGEGSMIKNIWHSLHTVPVSTGSIQCSVVSVGEEAMRDKLSTSSSVRPFVTENPVYRTTHIYGADYVALETCDAFEELVREKTAVPLCRPLVVSLRIGWSQNEVREHKELHLLLLEDQISGFSRYQLHKSAYLLANHSVPPFSTEMTRLMKPTLLGLHPGLLIACFAPQDSTGRPESFKSAFALADLASSVYCARLGLDENCPAFCLPPPHTISAAADEPHRDFSLTAPASHSPSTDPSPAESRLLAEERSRVDEELNGKMKLQLKESIGEVTRYRRLVASLEARNQCLEALMTTTGEREDCSEAGGAPPHHHEAQVDVSFSNVTSSALLLAQQRKATLEEYSAICEGSRSDERSGTHDWLTLPSSSLYLRSREQGPLRSASTPTTPTSIGKEPPEHTHYSLSLRSFGKSGVPLSDRQEHGATHSTDTSQMSVDLQRIHELMRRPYHLSFARDRNREEPIPVREGSTKPWIREGGVIASRDGPVASAATPIVAHGSYPMEDTEANSFRAYLDADPQFKLRHFSSNRL